MKKTPFGKVSVFIRKTKKILELQEKKSRYIRIITLKSFVLHLLSPPSLIFPMRYQQFLRQEVTLSKKTPIDLQGTLSGKVLAYIADICLSSVNCISLFSRGEKNSHTEPWCCLA